jgi:hypothetical protein
MFYVIIGPEVKHMSDEYLPLLRAAEYVGVSRVKLAQLAKEGVIPYVTSPLDKRVKLFKRGDLDLLKNGPRPPQASSAPSRSE